MRICFIVTAVFVLASTASAAESGRLTAIVVSPIHQAQVVHGDDGMDHVEYEPLVVSVFPEPVTLSSVTVLDPAGKGLMRIEGHTLVAATQTFFARTQTLIIPASAAVSVDVDLNPAAVQNTRTRKAPGRLHPRGLLQAGFDDRQPPD